MGGSSPGLEPHLSAWPSQGRAEVSAEQPQPGALPGLTPVGPEGSPGPAGGPVTSFHRVGWGVAWCERAQLLESIWKTGASSRDTYLKTCCEDEVATWFLKLPAQSLSQCAVLHPAHGSDSNQALRVCSTEERHYIFIIILTQNGPAWVAVLFRKWVLPSGSQWGSSGNRRDWPS